MKSGKGKNDLKTFYFIGKEHVETLFQKPIQIELEAGREGCFEIRKRRGYTHVNITTCSQEKVIGVVFGGNVIDNITDVSC